MTSIQVAEKAKTEGVQLFRLKKGAEGYDCKPYFTGNRRGWVIIDSFSASAILTVYNSINAEQRARYEKLPLVKMSDLAHRILNKS